MQDLKATQAREIDKATITEAETLAVNGVLVDKADAPAMQAGDFYFRPNVVTKTAEHPSGCFRRLGWILMGRHLATQSSIVYTLVMSCPFCGLPIMTDLARHIVSKNPLTISERIACPYSSQDPATAHAFRVTEGTIRELHRPRARGQGIPWLREFRMVRRGRKKCIAGWIVSGFSSFPNLLRIGKAAHKLGNSPENLH